MDIKLPNGYVVRGVPAGTSKEQVMQKAIAAGFAQASDFPLETQVEEPTTAPGMSPAERIAAITAAGEMPETLEAAAPDLTQQDVIASGIQKGVSFGLSPDVTGVRAAVGQLLSGDAGSLEDLQKTYSKYRERARQYDIAGAEQFPKTALASELAGGIAGGAAAIPKAAVSTIPRVAGTSAGLGAAYGAGGAKEGERLQEGVIAGTVGGVLGPVPSIAGRVLAPKIAPAVQGLLESKVPLTVGQRLGGVFKNIEEKATSIPVIGSQISKAQMKTLEGVNKDIANKVLAPIGKDVPKSVKPGYDTVKYVEAQSKKSYDKALRDVIVNADDTIKVELSRINYNAQKLPDTEYKAFRNELSDIFTEASPKDGMISGAAWKKADSSLGRHASNLLKNEDPNKQRLGRAFLEVKDSLRGALERSSGKEKLAQINNADETYGLSQIYKRATKMKGAKKGIITPSHLESAAIAMDKSLRKGATSRGDARFQQYAEEVGEIVGDTVPDTGTAGRGTVALIATGGLGTVDPITTAATLGGGAAAYTAPAQAALRHLLSTRPDLSKKVGGLLGGGKARKVSSSIAGVTGGGF